MRQVSPFEDRLLQLLRGFVGREEVPLQLLTTARPRPVCLSADAVVLVADGLRKGLLRYLAEAGWRDERWLREETPIRGRWWQRHSARPLPFSAATLEFLLWATSESFAPLAPPLPLPVDAASPTLADRLFFTVACLSVRTPPIRAFLLQQPAIGADPLLRLHFPEADPPARMVPSQAALVSDWHRWLGDPLGLALLEALQRPLVARWHELEGEKRNSGHLETAAAIGDRQEQVLRGYLDAVAARGRRDLAQFVVLLSRQLLRERPVLADWLEGLPVEGIRLADRSTLYLQLLAPLTALLRVADWVAEARAIGYFDDGYQASQWLKGFWEDVDGERLARHAHDLLRACQPLHGR